MDDELDGQHHGGPILDAPLSASLVTALPRLVPNQANVLLETVLNDENDVGYIINHVYPTLQDLFDFYGILDDPRQANGERVLAQAVQEYIIHKIRGDATYQGGDGQNIQTLLGTLRNLNLDTRLTDDVRHQIFDDAAGPHGA